MSKEPLAIHYVSTYDEAWSLVENREQYWVSNCGCRERNGGCAQSRMDLCLSFAPVAASGGGNYREITRDEVKAIFTLAKEKQLVARPFRSEDRKTVDGICFCCTCCCSYFTGYAEACDKGQSIEQTDTDACIQCGDCEEVCYFNARTMTDDDLIIDREQCYGCGLCVDVCPAACIEMVQKG